MKFKIGIISGCLFLSHLISPAQNINEQPYTLSPKFMKASELYSNGNYNAALKLFKELYNDNTIETYYEKANTTFYLANCHQLVGDSYLAEIYYNDFLRNYPENLHNNEAIFALGQIQFANKSYRTAIETFNTIDVNNLKSNVLDEYYYKLGYCYLKTNKTEEAKATLQKSIQSDTEYGRAALYFYGMIAYDENNFQEAQSCFEKLSNDEVFGKEAEQYLIRIYSINKQFDSILAEYEKYTEVKNKKDNIENIKIFADAFFQKGDFDKSIELYNSIDKNLTPKESYQLAFSYLSTEEYEKSIPYFEDAVAAKDTLSQNALYHIGICHLKTGNKNFAATSFREASKMTFDKSIADKALFNYVKIVYETGFDPYNEALSSLQQFIKDNPKSEYLDEGYSYLAKLFLSTNNYKQALEVINELDVLNDDLKSAYQKINYSSGIESFKAKKYSNAITLLQRSKKYPQDAVTAANASFWIGESYYRQNDFNKAIKEYKVFLSSSAAKKSSYFTTAKYSLGYCYFKEKNYSEAADSFNSFISSSNKNQKMLSDACNRIGDCNFILQRHNDAIKYYDRAMTYADNQNDYSLYYKATALGAINKLNDKAETLKEIIAMPQQTLMRSTAMFELANTYTLNNQTSKAIETYTQFINEYPKNNLVVKAKQKLGLLYYNQNNNGEALTLFKDIVTKYPGTKESAECLNIMKNIYVEEGKVDDYLDFVNNTAHIKTTVSEADSLSHSSAQKLYLSGKYDKAKEASESYLKKYPNGAYATECNFYLGDCLFQSKKYNEALPYFTKVYNANKSVYTENARLKTALIHQYNKNYKVAAELFEQVIAKAEYDYIIEEANVELMRCYYEISDFNKLLSISKTVMGSAVYDEEIRDEAKFYHAKSLYNTGKIDQAYTEFTDIANDNSGVESAESKYMCCFITYTKADYEKAEKETFELVQNYSSYDYWIAKGFILLADIYTKTGNEFQAIQTLQSIIDNYQGEDLKKEAQDKLNQLNKNEDNE